MSESDTLSALARRVWDESVNGNTVLDLADALHLASGRLQTGLMPVFGSAGTRQIWGRAIRQATAREPLLAGIVAYDEGVEIPSTVRRQANTEASAFHAACLTLLTNFLMTLADLVGPELTVRLVDETLNTTTPSGAARRMEDS